MTRVACPVPGCASTLANVNGVRTHIRTQHRGTQLPLQALQRLQCKHCQICGCLQCHNRACPECAKRNTEQAQAAAAEVGVAANEVRVAAPAEAAPADAAPDPAAAGAQPAAAALAQCDEPTLRPSQTVPYEARAAWSRAVETAVLAALDAIRQHSAPRTATALHALLMLPSQVLMDARGARGAARRVNARLDRLERGVPLEDEQARHAAHGKGQRAAARRQAARVHTQLGSAASAAQRRR